MTIPTLTTAIELPSGVYNVVSALKYASPALTWYFWQLDDERGNQTTLGLIADQYVSPSRDPFPALPTSPQLDHESQPIPLLHQGEAMATLSLPDKHDFWLAKFRHYATDQIHLIFTNDKSAVHRLIAKPISSDLIRLYQ